MARRILSFSDICPKHFIDKKYSSLDDCGIYECPQCTKDALQKIYLSAEKYAKRREKLIAWAEQILGKSK